MFKSERDIVKFVAKIWGVILSLFAGMFFTKTVSLADTDTYLGAMNIALFFLVAIYSIYCTMVSIKENRVFISIFACFSGGLLCLAMAILQIFWFNIDQVLVTWLNLLYTSAEFATGLYIGFVINLIHDMKTVNLRKDKMEEGE